MYCLFEFLITPSSSSLELSVQYSSNRSVVAVGSRYRTSLRIRCTASCEVGVVASCLRRDTVCRVVLEHGLEQLYACWFESRYKLGNGFSSPFREGCLEVGEGRHARPGVLVGGAQDPVSGQDQYAQRGNKWTYLKILKISSISESPGKRGFRVHISAKMAPTDHMSTPVEYCLPPKRISGARYHNVTTS
jgi:hypothetical protein